MKFYCILLPFLLAQCQVQVDGSPFWFSSSGGVPDSSEEETKREIREQLDMIRCPAQAHLELTDYWNCLWRSSVNADDLREQKKGMESERTSKMDFNEGATTTPSPTPTQKEDEWSRDSGSKSRKKRATIDRYRYLFTKYAQRDIAFSLLRQKENLKLCQVSTIRPASPLSDFVWCLRSQAYLNRGDRNYLGLSFDASFNPPPRKPIINSYDTRELPLLENVSNAWINWKGSMNYSFKRLMNEDTYDASGFGGADPYAGEQFSPFRYTYNNLDTNQRQPAWSFGGADGPYLWHKLDIRKFYSPVLSNAKLRNVETDSDIAQAYPGLGELAEHFSKIEAPLDYRWSKDSGYHAYTRFLIPVLSSTDVEYYKYKGLLDESFKIKSDAQVIKDLLDALQFYLADSVQPFVILDPVTKRPIENPLYPTVEKIPYNKVYEEFLSHYLFADTTRYVADLKADPAPVLEGDAPIKSLYYMYDVIRHVYRGYVVAVIRQLQCTYQIVKQVTTRRDEKDIPRVLNVAKERCIDNIRRLPGFNDTVHYVTPTQTLRFLYDTYFYRKESRQRYTLPLTPVQFPICQHDEPSPIDINTKKGRKSTLTSYKFGDVAYRLNKFFINFPSDGSTLLSVGIVDGERLDDSSVWLTGGAVKGQHLTFQTMLIRFGRDWESQGSEHLLDSKGGQMELQMIFTIAASADPIKYWHVLARVQTRLFQFREKLVIILSVLVDALETEEDVIQRIEEEKTQQDPYLFEPFAQAAYHFRKEREENSKQDEPRGYASLDPVFRLIDFIPKTKSKFYTYRGSLSWPPCFGYVIWSVYQQRLYITKRQFDEFIKIPAFGVVDHNRASDNFRLMEQIFVEKENDPNIDYTTRQNLIKKRTVDRFILEGIHDYNPEADNSLVDEAVYYLDSDSGAGQTKTCASTTTVAFLSAIYGATRE